MSLGHVIALLMLVLVVVCYATGLGNLTLWVALLIGGLALALLLLFPWRAS